MSDISKEVFLAAYGTPKHLDQLVNSKNTSYHAESKLIHNKYLSSKNLNTLYDTREHYYGHEIETLMKHPNADEQLLMKGATHQFPNVVHAAISHPNVTSAVINKAMDHDRIGIRRFVVKHPLANEETYTKGLKDPDVQVRDSAQARLHHLKLKDKPTGGFDPIKDPELASLFNHE